MDWIKTKNHLTLLSLSADFLMPLSTLLNCIYTVLRKCAAPPAANYDLTLLIKFSQIFLALYC